MTTPHKATPEQWADAGAFASDTRACLLELRGRLAAREAATRACLLELRGRLAAREAAATPPPAPAGGLVGRMRSAFGMREFMSDVELSSMIHVVAAWLQQRSGTIANGSQWAEILRREADR